jgi:hypothetical protein
MPKPTIEQLDHLGELVQPFERTNFKRKVLDGEGTREPFMQHIYDATENSYPPDVLLIEPNDIINGQVESAKYLWVITPEGLTIIREQTPNPLAERGIVCHTNLTNGGTAIQGGELWFGKNGIVYLNNKSGRYGATTLAQRMAILDYFRFVGYKMVEQLI